MRQAYLSLLRYDPFLIVHEGLRSRWLDGPMCALTIACEGWALFALGCAIVSLIELRSTAPRPFCRRWAAMILAVGGTLLVAGVAARRLKYALDTPRPLGELGTAHVRVLLEPLLGMGLPSGHASAAAALVAFLTTVYPGRVRWIWVLPLLGGVSRVYVGAHWVFDVISGWVIGILIGTVLAMALRMLRRIAPAPEA